MHRKETQVASTASMAGMPSQLGQPERVCDNHPTPTWQLPGQPFLPTISLLGIRPHAKTKPRVVQRGKQREGGQGGPWRPGVTLRAAGGRRPVCGESRSQRQLTSPAASRPRVPSLILLTDRIKYTQIPNFWICLMSGHRIPQ